MEYIFLCVQKYIVKFQINCFLVQMFLVHIFVKTHLYLDEYILNVRSIYKSSLAKKFFFCKIRKYSFPSFASH